MRKMPDGVPAGHAGPWLHHVIGRLLKKGSLAPLRRLNGHLPVAAGGTEYVSSTEIGCPNRRAQEKKDGSIRKFHAMACTASCRREGPGSATPPEFITPRDGAGKQDCERAAVKRWLGRVGPWAVRLKPALRVMISIAASRSARRSGPPGATSCRSACHHPVSRYTNMFMEPAWTACGGPSGPRGQAQAPAPHPVDE